MAFVYNDLLEEFGIAAMDIKFIIRGNDREYFSSDFEKILNKFWDHSPCEHWTRIEIRFNDGVLWFAKHIVFSLHYCGINCSIISEKFDTLRDIVIESRCIYLKDDVIKCQTFFNHKCITNHNYVLLEFQECFETDYSYKLKFKRISDKAYAPRRVTKGSVGYNLYSVEKVLITSQSCSSVATDITLISPGVYPRVAPHSSMALKNINV